MTLVRFRLAVFASLVLTSVSAAQAAVITFTDRATWLAAVGPLSGTEGFSSFASDTEFRTTTVFANNMAISSGTGTNGTLSNKIDASPFEFADTYPIDGSTYLLGDLLTPGNADLHINFTTELTAWGADFRGIANDGRPTQVDIFDSSNVLLGTVPMASTGGAQLQFYGFQVTGGTADRILIANSSSFNDVFGIDNVGFVTTAAIPEPSTYALMLAGLGFVGFVASRRRKAQPAA